MVFELLPAGLPAAQGAGFFNRYQRAVLRKRQRQQIAVRMEAEIAEDAHDAGGVILGFPAFRPNHDEISSATSV